MVVWTFGIVEERAIMLLLFDQCVEAVGIAPFLHAQQIVAAIDHDAHQPTFKTAPLKHTDGAVRLDKALLHHIRGAGFILQSAHCHAKGKALIIQNQLVKRIQITPLCAGDQRCFLS